MFDTLFSSSLKSELKKMRTKLSANFKSNFSEDLLSYEIGDIDVHDDGDDLDAVEDELLMSDDGKEGISISQFLPKKSNFSEPDLDDSKRSPSTKQVKKEVTGRPSINDKRIVSPSSSVTECSNKATPEKGPKKRALKRNVTTPANTTTPSKQVKQATDEQSQQNATKESQSIDGTTTDPILEQKSTHPLPVTPAKANKTPDACSLSELESPVASLIFSSSGDTPTTTTTSQDESCSCVEESESESVSLTQQSQENSSAQNSQEESAATDDFDSDYNKHKVDTELEDSDDCPERMNARLCVERNVNQGEL